MGRFIMEVVVGLDMVVGLLGFLDLGLSLLSSHFQTQRERERERERQREKSNNQVKEAEDKISKPQKRI